MNIIDILRLGAIGLGFLLAVLAYRLLQKEQAITAPRESILNLIKTYMFFSAFLVITSSITEIIKITLDKKSIEKIAEFDFNDYLQKSRVKYEHGSTPENFISGELSNLQQKTLTLDLPAGACKSFLAVTPPNTEFEINWWTNGPGARDVKFNINGEENIKFGNFCTSEDSLKPAQIGIQIKMLRGSGKFSLETFFNSQRIYGGEN